MIPENYPAHVWRMRGECGDLVWQPESPKSQSLKSQVLDFET